MELTDLEQGLVMRGNTSDASQTREQHRRKRLWKLLVVMLVPFTWFWYWQIIGNPIEIGLPTYFQQNPEILLLLVLVTLMFGLMLIPYLGAGRSPHTLLRPEDSDVRLADVVGASQTRREAIDTLNLFLNHQAFEEQLGGSPRRGVLFEGPPGTGKTYLAKALAAEAGVPFLFVSASEFQSMFYGQSNRKVRTFFKALRKHALDEGGAIGFIEEFDAIGGARAGMGSSSGRDTNIGMVNELLVQMQSFSLPTGWQKFRAWFTDRINRFLPQERALTRPTIAIPNVLVIAATNRADDLDPALLRPGRFDRRIYFDLPPRADRVEIADYYLAKKTHEDRVTAEVIADLTPGYTPVRIERLLDESLIVALRNGRTSMTIHDVIEAQLTSNVGMAHEVGYHPDERRRIAVHEAGHALAAVLTGRDIQIASILRRNSALGLVSHSDAEEKHLRTPEEVSELIVVALAGRGAEIQEFGSASSGIASDLVIATKMAAQLVGQLGGGHSLLSLEAADMPFQGNLVSKVMADPAYRAEADRVLNSAADQVACMMMEHRGALIAIADGLCEQDELPGDMITSIVASAMRV
jgi:cell division protease FtsH